MASAEGECIGGSLPPFFILLLSILLSFFFLYNEFLVSCYQEIYAQNS